MLDYKLLPCKRYLCTSKFVGQLKLYSEKNHMLKFLLVKKYLVLSFFLLLTSFVNIKAEVFVCPDIYLSETFFNLENLSDQLDKLQKKEPSFYPNPVRSVVNLTNQEDVTRIRIISLTGKTLIDIKAPKKSINLSHLPKGMYLINFDIKGGKRVARKLVKK